MKPYLFIIGTFLMLSSCATVYFTEPQPKGGDLQTEVPEILYGEWFNENEGWIINQKGITNINLRLDSLGVKHSDTSVTIILSDAFRIYKAKNLFVVNRKENNENWEVTIMKPMKNGDINMYRISDGEIIQHDKGLKLEEANFIIDDELKKVKTLTPEYEYNLSFENAVYSGQMKIKTLRKLITKNNLFSILKKDGTFRDFGADDEEAIMETEIEY